MLIEPPNRYLLNFLNLLIDLADPADLVYLSDLPDSADFDLADPNLADLNPADFSDPAHFATFDLADPYLLPYFCWLLTTQV